MSNVVLAIHEAGGQDVTMQKELAYSLVSGGGKPGQGYPCIAVIPLERYRQWIIKVQTDNMSRAES